MGAQESKLCFRRAVLRLYEERFWRFSNTAKDVFNLLPLKDIRKTRDLAFENLQTLIILLCHRIIACSSDPNLVEPSNVLVTQLLNAVRILTRVLPVVFETEIGSSWIESVFWTINDKNKRALGEQVMDSLLYLLFYVGFTIPAVDYKSKGVQLCIWETGVGCNTLLTSKHSYEQNKIEILLLLLVLFSETMYRERSHSSSYLAYVISHNNSDLSLSLLCSLLNTAMQFNTSFWKPRSVMSAHLATHATLVELCFTVFLTLITDPVIGSSSRFLEFARTRNIALNNFFSKSISQLHRKSDFQFILDGFSRLLYSPIHFEKPNVVGVVMYDYYPLTLNLCKQMLHYNTRFFHYLVDTGRALDLFVFILYLSFEYLSEASTFDHLKICLIILRRLTTSKQFCEKLNIPFEQLSSLPTNRRVPFSKGSYADFSVTAMTSIITACKDYQSEAVLLLTETLSYLVKYVDNITIASSRRLVKLFVNVSDLGFLLANPTNFKSTKNVYKIFGNLLRRRFSQNPKFVYTVLRAHETLCSTIPANFSRAKEIVTQNQPDMSVYLSSSNKTYTKHIFERALLDEKLNAEKRQNGYSTRDRRHRRIEKLYRDVDHSSLESSVSVTHPEEKPFRQGKDSETQNEQFFTRAAPLSQSNIDYNTDVNGESKLLDSIVPHAYDHTFTPTKQWYEEWRHQLDIEPFTRLVELVFPDVVRMRSEGFSSQQIFQALSNCELYDDQPAEPPSFETSTWRDELAHFSKLLTWSTAYDLDRRNHNGMGIWTNTEVRLLKFLKRL
ncbi:dymeclin 1 [Schizosaccharomyces japonicus yFS275]|uniref:Dymeclin 1 n=1 Tax=Schizosaccharomyces japonicus (strain yFS275 / FY16936) TaxID=402676 RepID=B6JW01_SCHJY|nr:dymeclin 1 [Schizosaccharomyces japonicus yFS275]EEB05552.1 dymeclin 1 [Schizosaccharomyces japonicus yFS275]